MEQAEIVEYGIDEMCEITSQLFALLNAMANRTFSTRAEQEKWHQSAACELALIQTALKNLTGTA